MYLGERLIDDTTGRRMHARIGNTIQPMPELDVQVIDIAEGAAEEEVLADIAERPLHLAFRLRPVGPTRARLEAVMPGEIEKRAIVDHEPVQILADDGCLHSVVKHFAGSPADRLERGDVATQNGLQILVQDEARPDQPAVAQHHREQPDDAPHPGLCAKSTCACSPGGVSNRTSNPAILRGRNSRSRSVIAVY